MPKIAGFLTLIFVLAQWGGAASAQTCEYAGQTFSLGSTVCECPNLRIVRSAASAGRGEITSRRLACGKDQTWVNTNSLCLVAYTSADHAENAFRNSKSCIAHVFRSITPNCKKASPRRRKSFSAWRRAAKCLSPSRPFAAALPAYLNTAKR